MIESKSFSKTIFFIITLLSVMGVYPQVGIGTTSPNPDALLVVFSATKGLLMPRVALTTTNLSAPLSNNVMGMTVYNTANAGAGATAVSPGYYVNNGTKWIRMADAALVDLTDDAWVNNPTNTRVELGKMSTGASRSAAAAFVALDNGNVGIGNQNPLGKLHIDGANDNSAVPTTLQMANDLVVMPKTGFLGIGTLTANDPITIKRGDSSDEDFIVLDNSNGKFIIGRNSDRGTLNMGSGYIVLESSAILSADKLLIMSNHSAITSVNRMKGIIIDEINASGTRIAKVNIGSSLNSATIASFMVSNKTQNIGTLDGGTLRGSAFYQEIIADANNLNLIGVDIKPIFNDNGYTGTNHYGLLVREGNVGIGTATPTVKLEVDGMVKAKAYTVAMLPAGVEGAMAYVTDALAPSYLATVVGGGNIKCPLF